MTAPATFYDCLALMLVLLYALMNGGAGGRFPDVNTLNVRRVAGGAAGLAVFAFVMVSAANDVHGFGRLAEYFAQLRDRAPPPVLLAVSLAVVGCLGLVSIFRFGAGWRGPFPPRRSMMAGGEFLWLLGAAGVWFWGGLFLEERGSWLGHWAHVWNFGLTALLLFYVVHSIASMAVVLRNPRAAVDRVNEDIAAGEFHWDEPRRRKWWQRKR
jgi:hypothetical protein